MHHPVPSSFEVIRRAPRSLSPLSHHAHAAAASSSETVESILASRSGLLAGGGRGNLQKILLVKRSTGVGYDRELATGTDGLWRRDGVDIEGIKEWFDPGFKFFPVTVVVCASLVIGLIVLVVFLIRKCLAPSAPSAPEDIGDILPVTPGLSANVEAKPSMFKLHLGSPRNERDLRRKGAKKLDSGDWSSEDDGSSFGDSAGEMDEKNEMRGEKDWVRPPTLPHKQSGGSLTNVLTHTPYYTPPTSSVGGGRPSLDIGGGLDNSSYTTLPRLNLHRPSLVPESPSQSQDPFDNPSAPRIIPLPLSGPAPRSPSRKPAPRMDSAPRSPGGRSAPPSPIFQAPRSPAFDSPNPSSSSSSNNGNGNGGVHTHQSSIVIPSSPVPRQLLLRPGFSVSSSSRTRSSDAVPTRGTHARTSSHDIAGSVFNRERRHSRNASTDVSSLVNSRWSVEENMGPMGERRQH